MPDSTKQQPYTPTTATGNADKPTAEEVARLNEQYRQQRERAAAAAQEDDSETRTTILDLLEPEVLAWHEQALCAQTDPEAFFPEKGGSTREAKRVCTTCDVRVDCLEYALDKDERFGIWGGLSERERRRLKKATR